MGDSKSKPQRGGCAHFGLFFLILLTAWPFFAFHRHWPTAWVAEAIWLAFLTAIILLVIWHDLAQKRQRAVDERQHANAEADQ